MWDAYKKRKKIISPPGSNIAQRGHILYYKSKSLIDCCYQEKYDRILEQMAGFYVHH